MKQKCIAYSINYAISKYVAEVKSRHVRKYNCLLNKSKAGNVIQSNPKNVVWNFSSRHLTSEEYDFLWHGLNHDLSTNLRCNEVLPSVESVWDQLTRNSLLTENYHSINGAKNCLRALAFNLINLDNQKVLKDKRKLQVIKKLHKDTVILKPDKVNGVVVIDTTDYYESLNNLFSDTTKFKRLDANPTNTRLSTLQFYLRKLYNRNEISEKVYQEIRPKNAKIARAHGLPKVHMSFERVSSFRPIIDTIISTRYNVEKYITKLLIPLTQNKYSLEDTFDAAERIKKIPKELIRNKNYTLISLDVVSLFTNVPLRKAVNIILDRVYN